MFGGKVKPLKQPKAEKKEYAEDLVVKQYLKMGINGLVMIYRARCLETDGVLILGEMGQEEKACWSWKIHPPRSRKHADSRDVEVGTTAKKVCRKTNMMSVSERLLKEFCYLICHKVMNLPLTTMCTQFLQVVFAGYFYWPNFHKREDM